MCLSSYKVVFWWPNSLLTKKYYQLLVNSPYIIKNFCMPHWLSICSVQCTVTYKSIDNVLYIYIFLYFHLLVLHKTCSWNVTKTTKFTPCYNEVNRNGNKKYYTTILYHINIIIILQNCTCVFWEMWWPLIELKICQSQLTSMLLGISWWSLIWTKVLWLVPP